MRLSVTKTDESDAVLQARYGQMTLPAIYHIVSDALLRLRQKRTLLRQIQKAVSGNAKCGTLIFFIASKGLISQTSLRHILNELEAAIKNLMVEIEELTQG
jgi:transposase